MRLLGEGGMGAVYEAHQISTGAARALKVMQPGMLSQPGLKERFIQEARVGARIQSDHVVQVVSAGVDAATGAPWMAMELLSGMGLSDAVERRGPLPWGEVREIFSQLGHAMSAAHAAGVVHRDLKPENIYLASGRLRGHASIVKVLDFGIAKILDIARTKSTGAMGSQLWMAPEQTSAGDRVSFATDIWAMGLIAFYVLTGRSYWRSATSDAGSMVLLREILMEPLALASVRARELGASHLLPPGFDGWLAQCVCREPAGRFQSVDRCVAELCALFDRATAAAPDRDAFRGTIAAMPIAAPSIPSFTAAPHAPGLTQIGPSPVQSVSVVGSSHTVPRGPQRRSSLPRIGIAIAAVAGGAVIVAGAFLIHRSGRAPEKTGATGSASGSTPTAASCERAFLASDAPSEASLSACRTACDESAAPSCRYLADLERRDGIFDVAQAITLYERGCSAGDDPACERAADLDEKRGTAIDVRFGKHEKACQGGRAVSCAIAGDIAERRTDRDAGAEALALFDKACEGGLGLGCADLGRLLQSTRVPPDRARAEAASRKAAERLEAACTSGRGRACVALGQLREVDGKADEAKRAYESACGAGVLEGCTSLGVLLAFGRGVPPDFARAEGILTKACEGGEATACNDLGVLAAKIPSVPVVTARGATSLKLACDTTLIAGCTAHGKPLPAVSPTRRYDESQRLLALACDKGDRTGCVNLGGLVRLGLGGRLDVARAGKLFEDACRLGDGYACGEQGTMAWIGLGVRRDRAAARKAWRAGCDRGDRDACVQLVNIDLSHGDAATATRAFEEASKGCAAGDNGACQVVASAYTVGKGTARDLEKAAALDERLCEGREVDAPSPGNCISYATRFFTGAGVPKDPSRAIDLLGKRCAAGIPDACREVSWAYVEGSGGTKDPARGIRELEALCRDAANNQACSLAAFGSIRQNIATQSKPIDLALRGCTLGDGSGCAVAADFLSLGKGGASIDQARAKSLYADACDNGVDWACAKAK